MAMSSSRASETSPDVVSRGGAATSPPHDVPLPAQLGADCHTLLSIQLGATLCRLSICRGRRPVALIEIHQARPPASLSASAVRCEMTRQIRTPLEPVMHLLREMSVQCKYIRAS